VNDRPVSVKAVMNEVEGGVRRRLQDTLVKRGGAPEYRDETIFESVRAVLSRAADERNLNALLLPELLGGDLPWELRPDLSLSTHRRTLYGRVILLAKRRLLLPLTRWLFEYSQENFRRQHHLNRILFACVEELAIENARLRRDMTDLSNKGQGPGAPSP
jgi:hypothetical protein